MSGKLDFLESWLSTAIKANLQVILVHDIQDSDTSGEIQKLVRANAADNLRFIEGYFGSPGAARNQGIQEVVGDWVAFWDSDDQPSVENFVEMVRMAEREKADIAIGDFLRTVHPIVESDAITRTRQMNLDTVFRDPGLWRFAFRTKKLNGLFFKDFLIGEDLIFLLESEYFSKEIFFFEKIVYRYSINVPGQATGSAKALNDYSRTLAYLGPKLSTADSCIYLVTYLKLLAGSLKHMGIKANLKLVLKTLRKIIFKPALWPDFIKASRLLLS
jgi:glycosyltransferase involved in cell wall biosynthesis